MKNLLLWSNPSPQPGCPESPFHAHDFKYEKKETVGKKLIQNSKFWIHRDEITAHYIICFKAKMPLFLLYYNCLYLWKEILKKFPNPKIKLQCVTQRYVSTTNISTNSNLTALIRREKHASTFKNNFQICVKYLYL